MSKITEEIVNQCMGLVNSPDNQSKIRCFLIDPILNYVAIKAYPYFITLTILLIINIIFLGLIIYFITRPST